MEKTAVFFGEDNFRKCLKGTENEALYERILNLMSHGKYSIYEPMEMIDDNKILFKDLLTQFLERYKFNLSGILKIEEDKT